MSSSPQLMYKSAVAERLGISERTLEKLVATRQFPRPLKLGKYAVWDQDVVERWLVQALAPQQAWEAPKRGRFSARQA